jgi:polysaccharide deacetylase 2 family uncharacterized protein YibQ
MAVQNKNSFRKQPGGARIAVLVILVLIIAVVSGYFLFSPPGKPGVTAQKASPPPIKPIIPAAVPHPSGATSLPPTKSPPTLNKKSDYPQTIVVPESEKLSIEKGGAARLAIIIDDMGSSMSEARSLAAIKVPLTFAIIPGLRVDTDVAAYAVTQNIETMIHIPMQSKGWPERRLEKNGLLVAMSDEELQERVSEFVRLFPGAVGVNNHMGSEFTAQEDKMTVVLQILKKNNLFFIDSMTSAESCGGKIAHRLGLKSARRNVFLDNEQERGYILGQLNQAIRLAKKNGSAIAICHPHPATIAALAAALPELGGHGVTLVSASLLAR